MHIHPHYRRDRGFAIAPILYLLGILSVGAGILFSGFSQILRSGQNVESVMIAKSDLQATATALAATSWLSSDHTRLCPPMIGSGAPGKPSTECAGAPGAKTIGAAFDKSVAARLPAGFATVASAGAPVEIGVFGAGAGVKVLDPWGHYYIYCRWENPIGGANALMVISAGPSGKLQTTCGDDAAKGDNLLVVWSTGVAQNRASVWQTVTQGTAVTGAQFGATGTQINIDPQGDVTIPGTLGVAGATTLGNGGLAVNGSSSFNSASNFLGGLVATTGVFNDGLNSSYGSFSGPLSGTTAAFSGALAAGTTTLSSLAVTNNASVGGNTSLTGNLATGGYVMIGTSTNGSSAAGTTPLLAVGKAMSNVYPFSVDQSGDVLASGTLGVTGATTLGNTLNVGGATVLGNTLEVKNTTQLDSDASISGNSTLAGTLTVGGATSLNAALTGTTGTFSGTVSAANFVGGISLGNGNGGGGVTLTGMVPVVNGGTGEATAAAALTNLFNLSGVVPQIVPGADLYDKSVTIQQIQDTGVVPGTYTQMTVESDGRITLGGISASITDSNGNGVSTGSSGITYTVGSSQVGGWSSTGLMIGSSSPAIDELDVYGATTIGTAYAGTNAAPQNGLLVQGQVAIGTTTANGALNVSGTANATNFFTPGMLTSSAVYTNRIGIGTTVPGSLLEVYSSTSTPNLLTVNAATLGANGESDIQLTTTDGGANGGNLNVAGDKGWQISARGNSFANTSQAGDLLMTYWDGGSWVSTLALAPTGFVGLGSSAPQSKLQVYNGEIQTSTSGSGCTSNIAGAIRYAGGDLFYCDNTNTWEQIDSSGADNSGDYMTATQTTAPTAGQGVYGADPSLGAVIIGSGSIADATLENKSGTPGLELLTGTTAVYMPGTLGIGTTSVGSLLNVNGGVSIGTSYVGTAAPTNGAIIQGNVGIGTTAPGSVLSVYAPSSTTQLFAIENHDFVNGTTGSGMYMSTGTSSGNTNFNIQATINGGANGGSLTLNPTGGNVGIGTTSPGETVDVYSSGSHNGVKVRNSGGNYLELFDDGNAHLEGNGSGNFWINGDINQVLDISHGGGATYINDNGGNVILASGGGNVGIGNNSPQYTLDVTGTGHVSGNLTASSNIYWGTGGNWLSAYLNQAVLTTSNVTFNTVTSTDYVNICTGNRTGCYLRFSDDGYIQDNNDGYLRFYGTYWFGNTLYGNGDIHAAGNLYADGNNVHLGYLNDWLSNYVNQQVTSGSSPNFWNPYIGYMGTNLSNWLNQSVTTGSDVQFDKVGYTASWYSSGDYMCMVPARYLGICSSDRRLKNHITYIKTDALPIIMKLKPARFRVDADKENTPRAGFIAQDVGPFIPEAAHIHKGAKYYTFDSTAILSYLVKAVQELKKIVDRTIANSAAIKAHVVNDVDPQLTALKAENADLKAEITAVKARLDALEAERNQP